MRERFDFWLDMRKDKHLLLAETIDELKRNRQFSRAIREGLMLWYSLSVEGDTDLLYRLFPNLRPGTAAPVDDNLHSKLDALLERIDRDQEPTPLQPVSSGSGPRQMNAPSFDMPTFDDDDDLLETVVMNRAGSDGGQSAQNFLDSLSSLQ